MLEPRFPDAHNVIVDAITQDLSKVIDFEDHDPLGIAFYVFALLKADYIHFLLNSFPDAAQFWVEEKLSGKKLSPYIDRDLGAIGLIAYALCKYRTCPDNGERFNSLVEPHFDDNRGIFDNFLITVLVGLGLKALIVQSNLCDRITTYINDQIKNHTNAAIFNDTKNLVAAYIWAKELKETAILHELRHECAVHASREDCLPRELVYLSYVLLEEASDMPRSDRSKVKSYIEKSLRFIQIYSLESGFTPDIIEHYSYDVVSNPTALENHGHPARPRLSRMMLSVGLMIERKYSTDAQLLFSSEAKTLGIIRGVFYFLNFLLVTALVIWLSTKFGIPISQKSILESKDFSSILTAIFIQIPVNVILITIILTLLVSAWIFLHHLALTGQRRTELEAGSDVVNFLRENWLIEVLVAFLLSIIPLFIQA